MLLSVALPMCYQLTGHIFITFYSTTLFENTVDREMAMFASVGVGAAGFLSSLLSIPFGKYGRKFMNAIGYGGLGLLHLLLGILALAEISPIAQICFLMIWFSLLSCTCGCVFWAYIGEVL